MLGGSRLTSFLPVSVIPICSLYWKKMKIKSNKSVCTNCMSSSCSQNSLKMKCVVLNEFYFILSVTFRTCTLSFTSKQKMITVWFVHGVHTSLHSNVWAFPRRLSFRQLQQPSGYTGYHGMVHCGKEILNKWIIAGHVIEFNCRWTFLQRPPWRQRN